MPKAKTRRKGTPRPQQTTTAKRRQLNTRAGNVGQSLVMSALVALGCWGLAFSFTFFSNEPNRFLFGGMAALMALTWTIIFILRLRRVLQK